MHLRTAEFLSSTKEPRNQPLNHLWSNTLLVLLRSQSVPGTFPEHYRGTNTSSFTDADEYRPTPYLEQENEGEEQTTVLK